MSKSLINKRITQPIEDKLLISFFLLIQNFFFDLMSSHINENFEDFIKIKIIDKVNRLKQFKIQEILDPNLEKDLKLKNKKNSEYMMFAFNQELEEKETEDYFIKDVDEKEENFKKIEKINKVFDNVIQCKNKYILLEPKELFILDNDKIHNYYESFKFDSKHLLFDKPYVVEKLDEMLNSQNIEFDNNIFNGFDETSETNRIMIMTHNSVIIELLNVINRCKGLSSLTSNNNVNNCSISVLKIYCSDCNGKCIKSNNENCNIEFDLILLNDSKHLEYLA